ncbi:hypothetical protein [Virgibacillus necropolis]|uniref:Uncharacterized protein n=1 Tax=Virgibacillus necropolis TaxID=163877 RepID=A0A221MA46_9BACI|nr:hypothetical protein [Virgibacillus necropolis]ASN04480.1 hypothetical protein CFK40_05380 [Virgibacillus necropolis]
MRNPIIIARDKQQSNQLEIKRMSIYRQSKIIEATDEQDQTYYIFFYKDHYLNYVTPEKTSIRSHVIDSFKKGVTLISPHPLIETVVSPYPHFKKQNSDDLFKQFLKHHSLQETALIASYFESFIKKDELTDFIETLFYKERRDGKLLSCYRILHILKDIAPNHTIVSNFSRDLQFMRYDELYKNADAITLARDPIYMEKRLYSSKHNDQPFQKLIAIYKEQNRWVDLIAIHITRVVHTQKTDDYHALKSLVVEHYDDLNMLDVLEDLYARGLTIKPLQQDLLNCSLEHAKLEDVLTLINKHKLTLQPFQSQKLINLVKQKGITSGSIPPEALQKLVLTLFESKDDQASDILHQAVSSLLADHTLMYIQEWVQPLKDIPLRESILQKVDEMNLIAEDPNQQQRLGELYYYFNQPNKAIECISFDMELNAEDPKPVQWLAKLYHELGMEAEHKAFQQLYIDMVKRS